MSKASERTKAIQAARVALLEAQDSLNTWVSSKGLNPNDPMVEVSAAESGYIQIKHGSVFIRIHQDDARSLAEYLIDTFGEGE